MWLTTYVSEENVKAINLLKLVSNKKRLMKVIRRFTSLFRCRKRNFIH